MKKAIIAAFIVFVISLAAGINTVYAEAPANDSIHIYADTSDMPPGTAYIDLLGKISPESEYYTTFNESAAISVSDGTDTKAIVIDASSPVVSYNEDGYMSLSAHFRYFSSISVTGMGSEEMFSILPVSGKDEMNIAAFYKKFGRFRAAYVSASGEILGVTDTAQSVLTNEEIYKMKLDGTTAVFEFHSDSADNAKRLQDPVGMISLVVFVMFFIMLIALGIIVIRNIWRFIRQMQKK